MKASHLAVWLSVLFMTSACNLRFDAPILPNIGKKFPEGTNESQANKDLTSLSKTQASQKRWMINLVIDSSLADDLSLDRAANCAQLVELTDHTVVVDFLNVACPGNNEVGANANLQFTAAYSPMTEETDHYKLKIQSKEIGEMELVSNGSELRLTKLCTGRYDTYCIPSVQNRKLAGPPIPLY